MSEATSEPAAAGAPAEYFCPQCGARYSTPGICDLGHAPATVQPLDAAAAGENGQDPAGGGSSSSSDPAPPASPADATAAAAPAAPDPSAPDPPGVVTSPGAAVVHLPSDPGASSDAPAAAPAASSSDPSPAPARAAPDLSGLDAAIAELDSAGKAFEAASANVSAELAKLKG